MSARLIRWLLPALLLGLIFPSPSLAFSQVSTALKLSPAPLAFAPNEVIVRIQPGTAFVAGEDFKTTGTIDLGKKGRFLKLRLPEEVAVSEVVRELKGTPGVVSVEPNYAAEAFSKPNDPMYKDGKQWGLDKIGAPAAWNVTTGSSSVVIAFLDSGVTLDHPDLKGKLVPGYDFVNNDPDPSDDDGHGTWTAGIAAAATNNGVGVAGVSWGAKIMPVKVLDEYGKGYDFEVANGLKYAADHGARIANISAGFTEDPELVKAAVEYADSKGVLVVASSGNKAGAVSYPAAYPQVLAVGASTPDDKVASFSSYGSYLSLVAPGVNILSIGGKDDEPEYTEGDGTSASAPFVSGAAALVLSVNPKLTNDKLKSILTQSADNIAPAGWDKYSGWGRLNVARAVKNAAGVQPPSPVPQNQSVIQGTVSGAAPAEVTVTLNGGNRSATPDATGRYSFDALAAGSYTVSAQTSSGLTAGPIGATVSGAPDDVQTIDLTLSQPRQAPDAFTSLAWFQDSPDRRYFPETGHTVAYGFKHYWDTHGGLPVFGFPISEEFTEKNVDTSQEYTVQYFERARFEYHPEFAGTPYEVLLGRLGADLTANRVFEASPVFTSTVDDLYFPATGHSLSQPFLSYWQDNGGLAIFGYPISEPFQEGGYTVQYFERNRFEYHPDLPSPYVVSLGLLGDDYARRMGYLP